MFFERINIYFEITQRRSMPIIRRKNCRDKKATQTLQN